MHAYSLASGIVWGWQSSTVIECPATLCAALGSVLELEKQTAKKSDRLVPRMMVAAESQLCCSFHGFYSCYVELLTASRLSTK